MIPKIIHYCWFGGNPLPVSVQRCIASWKRFLPDYEIREWNENNFDVNMIPYTSEAYKAKKYAFVSDYARYWILYQYGGLYFDTDVEIIKNMDDTIAKGAFMGCENEAKAGGMPNEIGVNPGLGLGADSGLSLYREIIEIYNNLHFIRPDGTLNYETIVSITTRHLCKKGLLNTNKVQLVSGVWIYPKEYFCPKDYRTLEMQITSNTCSIHHFNDSWHSKYEKIERRFWKLLGMGNKDIINRIINVTKRFRRIFQISDDKK